MDNGRKYKLLNVKKSERIWRTMPKHHFIIMQLSTVMSTNVNFQTVNSLLGHSKQVVPPLHDDPASLSATFNHYFMKNIVAIRDEFPVLIARLPY